ncbi:prolyl aminopeptidase [Vibrio marinisediminis]|nr:prolyl aminopeptidase [Vibrio marinisediminis]
MSDDLRTLYPSIEPYAHYRLDMASGRGEITHQIYIEECGNPQGKPIVFLHGGPGSGCSPSHRRFFNPRDYRIILFDQRGCGRSLPYGCIENNTTWHLVADMEQIRQFLGIESWMVFGGSWGATLALVYAQQYAERVSALILRGVFLGRQQDIDWVYGAEGAAKFYPQQWGQLLCVLAEEECNEPLSSLYKHLISDDDTQKLRVKLALSQWESSLIRIVAEPFKPNLLAVDSDQSKKIQLHYCLNNCFLSDDFTVSQLGKISQIATYVIHGHYDMVCPVEQAWALYSVNPNIDLNIVPMSGHVADEPLILDAIIRLTDQLAFDS